MKIDSSHRVIMGKNVVATLAPSSLVLAGNEDNCKISDEFKFWPDLTTDCEVSSHCAFGKITTLIQSYKRTFSISFF